MKETNWDLSPPGADVGGRRPAQGHGMSDRRPALGTDRLEKQGPR